MAAGKENKRDFFQLIIRKIFSRDLGIFFMFLLMAFILWYLNYLRKETETNLRLQLEFVNPPSGSAVANKTSDVYINLSGQGYMLFKFSLSGRNRKLQIDLSSVKPERNPGDISGNEFYLLTGDVLKEYLKNMPSAGLKVLSYKPDTLFLSLVKNFSQGKAE